MAEINTLNQVIQSDLLDNEKILWSGQPDPSVNFNKADISLIPFSVLWGGFAFIAFFSAVLNANTMDFSDLITIPFFVIGLYITVGRFVFKKIKKRNTYYAVTTKRVLIITTLFGKNIQSEYINTLAAINKSIRNSGIGTITFGNNSTRWAKYANTGLEIFNNSLVVPSFNDIKDANSVYKLISELRNKAVVQV